MLRSARKGELMRMRPRFRAAVAVVFALSMTAVATTSATASNSPQSELAAVRAATAKYHDVSVAVADGYVDPSGGTECVPGMGVHYINFALFGAPVDPLKPVGLLYMPSGEGLRLVGVEWFVIDEDQNPGTHNDLRPTLFGKQFDGPMPGHSPDMPVHYDLHAYIWKGNPDGVLTTWNPKVHC